MSTQEPSKSSLEETRRVITFAMENPGDWDAICNNMRDTLPAEECLMYIEQLEQHGLYCLIPVLLTNYQESVELQKGIRKFLLNHIFGTDPDIAALCREMKEEIRKAMA